MLFSQTAPLLPAVTQQQTNGMLVGRLSHDAMDEHNKIGGITFGAALVSLCLLQTISIAQYNCVIFS